MDNDPVSPADIAENELVAALMKALAAPADNGNDGYCTTRELCEMTNHGIGPVRRGLRQLGESGLLSSGQVMRHSVLLDRPARSWGYRLKVQATEAKEANK